ncbi:MAG: ribbon-helix-helix protein, CopG family [bacterium]
MDKSTFLLKALQHVDMKLIKKLERMAKRKKVTVTSLMRMALTEWLDEEEAQEQMSKDCHEIVKRISPEDELTRG